MQILGKFCYQTPFTPVAMKTYVEVFGQLESPLREGVGMNFMQCVICLGVWIVVF